MAEGGEVAIDEGCCTCTNRLSRTSKIGIAVASVVLLLLVIIIAASVGGKKSKEPTFDPATDCGSGVLSFACAIFGGGEDFPKVVSQVLEEAARVPRQLADEAAELSPDNAPINDPKSAEFAHFSFARQSDGAEFFGNLALEAMIVAQGLNISGRDGPMRDADLHEFQATLANSSALNGTGYLQKCPTEPTCNLSENRYRTINGSCNNLQANRRFGMSFTPLRRLIPHDYADGLFLPRVAANNEPLPSPRLITNLTLGRKEVPSKEHTTMLVAFGQFLDHDLDHVPFQRASDGHGIECCTEEGEVRELTSREEQILCLPIVIPENDPLAVLRRRKCINFVRSVTTPNLNCTPDAFQQINQITHWLDSSNVYGSLEGVSEELREKRDGLLKFNNRDNGMFLPFDDTMECRGTRCRLAGDLRVNEQPTLGAMHNLFLREHNRIARELKKLNANLQDEQLFQQARRILNAEWQHIIFNEFVPVVLGEEFAKGLGLTALKNGFSKDYDPSKDPSVSNAFAAAAFRLHTWINNLIRTVAVASRRNSPNLNLREVFSNGDLLQQDGMLDDIIKGLTEQPVEVADDNFVVDILDNLFDDGELGMDLVAINVQRGRDHGLPGYTKYRNFCGVSQVKDFDDLRPDIPDEGISKLKKAYKTVHDIDLFIGMSLEKPADKKEALLGKTMRCILADTFSRIKKGDRFFYDLEGQGANFTLAQLDQIRKVSLARLICDNTAVQKLQPRVMDLPNQKTNKVIDCAGIPKVDLKVVGSESGIVFPNS